MMISVAKAASYIFHRYMEENRICIDEMKLHKLLYLAQRESIIITGEPMFSAPFEAWKYGPVIVEIRDLYRHGALNETLSEAELAEYQPVFDYVFKHYANKDSWNLSILTHSESSWKNARKGLSPEDHGSTQLSLTDIRQDAEMIKLRRFFFDQVVPNLSMASPK
jgi:uncharacterized phage-associated protein